MTRASVEAETGTVEVVWRLPELSLPVQGELTAHEPTFDLEGGGGETASHLGYTC